MKNKDYPTIVEFIEALENEAQLYREAIEAKYPEDVFNIEDCLRWTSRIIKDFKDKIKKYKED